MKVIKIKVKDTFLIRKKVLRKDIDLPIQFDGDNDEKSFHLGVFKDDELVGVASLIKKNHKLINGIQYQLRGMAILEKVRGVGVGSFLLEQCFVKLEKENVNYLWCNARVSALEFYIKKGFIKISTPFEINLIGKHFVLVRKIQ